MLSSRGVAHSRPSQETYRVAWQVDAVSAAAPHQFAMMMMIVLSTLWTIAAPSSVDRARSIQFHGNLISTNFNDHVDVDFANVQVFALTRAREREQTDRMNIVYGRTVHVKIVIVDFGWWTRFDMSNSWRLKPGFHSNAIACVGKQPIMVATASTEHSYILTGACVCCVKFSRNKRKRQPIYRNARSKQWQPWLAACQRKRLRLNGNRASEKNTHLSWHALALQCMDGRK